MQINKLKEICEQKRMEVNHLYNNRCSDLIRNELYRFLSSTDRKLEKTNQGYTLNGNIKISIRDGNLVISDEHGIIHFWIFEVVSDICTSDLFFYEDECYYVRNVIDEKYCSKIENVIERLEESIGILLRKEMFEYSYYNDSSEIEVGSIVEALETVTALM